MEARERKEASGSPSHKKSTQSKKQSKKERLTHRQNKLDRNSLAKGLKVPLQMSSVPFGQGIDLFSGLPNQNQNMTFESTSSLRKKHLAALYQNASEN